MIDEKTIREIAKQEINNYAWNAQFEVVPIAAHFHTGTDSGQIDRANLIGVDNARVTTALSNATAVPNASSTDIYELSAQTVTAAFQNPLGGAVNGQMLWIRVTSNTTGTPRALTWDSLYLGNSPALPSTTATGKTSVIGFQYDTANAVNSWRLIFSTNS